MKHDKTFVVLLWQQNEKLYTYLFRRIFYLNQQKFLNSLKNQYFCCFDVVLCFRNGTATLRNEFLVWIQLRTGLCAQTSLGKLNASLRILRPQSKYWSLGFLRGCAEGSIFPSAEFKLEC